MARHLQSNTMASVRGALGNFLPPVTHSSLLGPEVGSPGEITSVFQEGRLRGCPQVAEWAFQFQLQAFSL